MDKSSPHVLPLEAIQRNPHQPREVFHEEELQDLMEDIREKGQQVPILVRPLGNVRPEVLEGRTSAEDRLLKEDQYELIDGERRVRALKALGKDSVLATILEVSSQEAWDTTLSLAFHTQGLHYLEQAKAFEEKLKADPSLTQEALGKRLGISVATVSEYKNLSKLTQEARNLIMRRRIIDTSHPKINAKPILHEVSTTVAVEVSRLKNSRNQVPVLEKLLESHMRRAQIRSLVKWMNQGKKLEGFFKRKPAGLPQVYTQVAQDLGLLLKEELPQSQMHLSPQAFSLVVPWAQAFSKEQAPSYEALRKALLEIFQKLQEIFTQQLKGIEFMETHQKKPKTQREKEEKQWMGPYQDLIRGALQRHKGEFKPEDLPPEWRDFMEKGEQK